jgi:hypothetical protein
VGPSAAPSAWTEGPVQPVHRELDVAKLLVKGPILGCKSRSFEP